MVQAVNPAVPAPLADQRSSQWFYLRFHTPSYSTNSHEVHIITNTQTLALPLCVSVAAQPKLVYRPQYRGSDPDMDLGGSGPKNIVTVLRRTSTGIGMHKESLSLVKQSGADLFLLLHRYILLRRTTKVVAFQAIYHNAAPERAQTA